MVQGNRLVKIDHGGALKRLADNADPFEFRSGLHGPINFLRLIPDEIKFNPLFTKELVRISQKDVSKSIHHVINKLTLFYDIKSLVSFANRLGMNNVTHEKETLLKNIELFLNAKMTARKQSLATLAENINQHLGEQLDIRMRISEDYSNPLVFEEYLANDELRGQLKDSHYKSYLDTLSSLSHHFHHIASDAHNTSSLHKIGVNLSTRMSLDILRQGDAETRALTINRWHLLMHMAKNRGDVFTFKILQTNFLKHNIKELLTPEMQLSISKIDVADIKPQTSETPPTRNIDTAWLFEKNDHETNHLAHLNVRSDRKFLNPNQGTLGAISILEKNVITTEPESGHTQLLQNLIDLVSSLNAELIALNNNLIKLNELKADHKNSPTLFTQPSTDHKTNDNKTSLADSNRNVMK